MMEIRIDTTKDSHEDIRKAIHFLKTIVGDSPDNTIHGTSTLTAETGNVLDSMFGGDSMPAPSIQSEDKPDKDNSPKIATDRITIIPY